MTRCRRYLLASCSLLIWVTACGDDTAPTDSGADVGTDARTPCGDGVCDGTETAESCAEDCPTVCGDGVTTHDEICDGNTAGCETVGGHPGDSATCLPDCSAYDTDACRRCGDGTCDADAEDALSCAGDCEQECGDTVCTGTETATSCAGDCAAVCGDSNTTHDEVCDGDTVDCGDLGGYAGDAATCRGDCSGYTTTSCRSCGDGTCDLGDGETAVSCTGDCPASCGDSLCTGAETPVICPEDCPASCGDGAVTHDEVCDGTSIACPTAGTYYAGDDAACNGTCSGYDDSACRYCGDGTVDGAEGEACDTSSVDCTTLPGGFPGGTASCDGSCAIDTSTCTPPPTCDVYYTLAGTFQISDTFSGLGDMTVPGLPGRLLLRYTDDGSGNITSGPVELRHISFYQEFDTSDIYTTVHNFAPACNGETAPTWRAPTDPTFPAVCEYDGVDRGALSTGTYDGAGAITWDPCASADYWSIDPAIYTPASATAGPGCINDYHSVGDVDCRAAAFVCTFGNLVMGSNLQNRVIALPQVNGPTASGANTVIVSAGETTLTSPTGAAGGFQSFNVPNDSPSRTWIGYVATRDDASAFTTCSP